MKFWTYPQQKTFLPIEKQDKISKFSPAGQFSATLPFKNGFRRRKLIFFARFSNPVDKSWIGFKIPDPIQSRKRLSRGKKTRLNFNFSLWCIFSNRLLKLFKTDLLPVFEPYPLVEDEDRVWNSQPYPQLKTPLPIEKQVKNSKFSPAGLFSGTQPFRNGFQPRKINFFANFQTLSS